MEFSGEPSLTPTRSRFSTSPDQRSMSERSTDDARLIATASSTVACGDKSRRVEKRPERAAGQADLPPWQIVKNYQMASEKRLSKSESQVAELRHENAELKNLTETLQSEGRQKHQMIDELKREVQDKNGIIDQLRREVEDKDKTINDLQRDNHHNDIQPSHEPEQVPNNPQQPQQDESDATEKKLKEELQLPWANFDTVVTSLQDPAKLAKLKDLIALASRRWDGRKKTFANHFANELLERDFSLRCRLPNMSPGSGRHSPGRHFFGGTEVWEMPTKFLDLYQSCARRYQQGKKGGARVKDITRSHLRDFFASRRKELQRKLLKGLQNKAKSSKDPDLRAYYELLYKDSSQSLKVLYDVIPPDLNDSEAVRNFCDAHSEEINNRYKERTETNRKRKETRKRRSKAAYLAVTSDEDDEGEVKEEEVSSAAMAN